MDMSFKRVVTGHNSQGRAVVAMAGAPPGFPMRALPGMTFHEIWNTSGSPAAINNGPDPALGPVRLQPAAQGSVIRVVDFPPDSMRASIGGDAAALFAEIGAAGASTGHASSQHMMHRTQTIDYGIVLVGEMWLVLDEGEVRLNPGDIVVQRGTNHAWSNRTQTVARMAFILLDGRYD